MKRTASIIAALTLVFVLAISVSALAGHHGGRGHHRATRYAVQSVQPARTYASVCPVEDCVLLGLHAHDGANYLAHYYNDGHDYHPYCDFAECELYGYHEHGGGYCFGRGLSEYGAGYGGYCHR